MTALIPIYKPVWVPSTTPSPTRFWTYEIDDGNATYVVTKSDDDPLRLALGGPVRAAFNAQEFTLRVLDLDDREHALRVAIKKRPSNLAKAAVSATAAPLPSRLGWQVGTILDVFPLPNAWVYQIEVHDYVYLATRKGKPCHATKGSPVAVSVGEETLRLIDEDGREHELGIDARKPAILSATSSPTAPDAKARTAPEVKSRSWQEGRVTDVVPLVSTWTYQIETGPHIYWASKDKKPCRVTTGAPIRFAVDGDKLWLIDEFNREHKLRLERPQRDPGAKGEPVAAEASVPPVSDGTLAADATPEEVERVLGRPNRTSDEGSNMRWTYDDVLLLFRGSRLAELNALR